MRKKTEQIRPAARLTAEASSERRKEITHDRQTEMQNSPRIAPRDRCGERPHVRDRGMQVQGRVPGHVSEVRSGGARPRASARPKSESGTRLCGSRAVCRDRGDGNGVRRGRRARVLPGRHRAVHGQSRDRKHRAAHGRSRHGNRRFGRPPRARQSRAARRQVRIRSRHHHRGPETRGRHFIEPTAGVPLPEDFVTDDAPDGAENGQS